MSSVDGMGAAKVVTAEMATRKSGLKTTILDCGLIGWGNGEVVAGGR